MQFAEGLTDKQTAQAVAARIDWKYALGLELTDTSFDPSVRIYSESDFWMVRWKDICLTICSTNFPKKATFAAGGKQRTDSTHVLAAIRKLNRVECVGETMRKTLNDIATVAGEWLLEQITPDWFDLYGPHEDQTRLPQSKREQAQLQLRIGHDGYHLLTAIYSEDAPDYLAEIPSVEIMRQVWTQQYYYDNRVLKWRTRDQLPPNKQLIESPYDPEARNRTIE